MTTIPRTEEDIRDQAKQEILLVLAIAFKDRSHRADAVGNLGAAVAYSAAAKLCQSHGDELLHKLLVKSVAKANDVARERAIERGES